jgi:hypothetical protein
MGLIKSIVFSLFLAFIGIVVGWWIAEAGGSSEPSTRILLLFFGVLFGFAGLRIRLGDYEP